MAVGPAQTVLHYLRGCGDCLCGRLCGPCRSGSPALISAGTVERVLPEAVVLIDGRVLRRPAGVAPRLGERVIVDQTAGIVAQTRTATPHGWAAADDAPLVIKPDYDAWSRPVVFGPALTWATADGFASTSNWPTQPVAVIPLPSASRRTISHPQQAVIRRDTELRPSLSYTLNDDDVVVFPFTPTQRRLTSTFPVNKTITVDDGDGKFHIKEEPGPVLDRVRWRIKGAGPYASGPFTGKQTVEPFGEGAVTQSDITVTGSAAVLEVEPILEFQYFDGTDIQTTVSVPDSVTLRWTWEDNGAGGTFAFSMFIFKLSGYKNISLPLGVNGQYFETVWAGQTQRAYINAITGNVSPANAGVQPEQGVIKSTVLGRLLWDQPPISPLADPDPLPFDFEADLGPLGLFTSTSTSGSVTGLYHNDHPQGVDTPLMTLNGAGIACTSWAVVNRRGEMTEQARGIQAAGIEALPEIDQPAARRAQGERGLLTCNGVGITAYWPGAPPASVDVGQLLGLTDTEGAPLAAGSVSDALLESELALSGHPDHVRIVWDAGRKAAILAPWNAWRDLLPSEWREAGKRRPKRLKDWYALAESQKPPRPAHGLAMQGWIRPPLPDSAGLPRYGKSPLIEYSTNPRLDSVWPWAMREVLHDRDQRPNSISLTGRVVPGVGLGLVVGRSSGRTPPFGDWVGRSEGRSGLRYFTWYGTPANPLTLPAGSRLGHLAVYLPDVSVDS